MKFFLKETGIFIGALIASIGITIGAKSIGYNGNPGTSSSKNPGTDIEMTKQEKFLASVMGISKADISGYVNIKTEQFTNAYDIYIDASGDISNLDDIKLNGEINANIDGFIIDGGFGFYDNTAFISIDQKNKFSLPISTVSDFVEKLPSVYGINLDLPEEFTNLDLDSIQDQIKDMDFIETPQGDMYFILELVPGLSLHLKTDADYNFKGVRTDSIFYQGTFIKLDINIEYVETTKYELANPLEGPDAALYQDFRPVFNLFDNLYRVFGDEKAGFSLDVNINKGEDKFMDAYIDLGLDIENNSYSISGNVDQSFVNVDRVLDFSADYTDNVIYAQFGNLKVSINDATVSALMSYVMGKINDETMDQVMDKFSELMGTVDVQDLLTKANNLLGQITFTDGKIDVNLNLDAFDDQLTPITLSVIFAEEGNPESFVGLSIEGFSFGEYSASLTLKTKDYQPHIIEKSEYVAIDPALRLITAAELLIKRDDFRIEMDGVVSDTTGAKDDITIDGGLQFNLPDQFGYGEMTIVDNNEYIHNIKADMKDVSEILLSYNDKMNVKFNINTMKDMIDLIMDVIENPDDHFKQLFGDLINSLKDGVIGKIIDGDYGALLSMRVIKDFQITDTKLSVDLDLNCIGFDVVTGFDILYADMFNENGKAVGSELKGIAIRDCEVGNTKINFNINLKEFDDSLESSRLDPYKEYLDFSDIKVLLELGINTSKYNYYHFTTDVSIALGSWDLLNFDLDLKIRVDEVGGVRIAAEFLNIPIIPLLTNNKSFDQTINGSRFASLYYDDGMFYTIRSEKVRSNPILIPGLFSTEYQYTEVRRFDTDFFIANVLEIFLKDIIGVSNSLIDSIDTSTISSASSGNMRYEDILKTFVYSENDNLFYFGISLKALMGMKESSTLIGDLNLTIHKKADSSELDGIQANLILNLGIKINVSLDIELVDGSVELNDTNKLTKLEECVAMYAALPLNELQKYQVEL